jgi:riboflavin kinase/FMN adenylyltransferase
MPTFTENVRQVEAHLIDFDGDLYNSAVTVEILDWSREQRAFAGVEPLKAQIQKDIAEVLTAQNREFTTPIASISFAASNLRQFA